MIMVGGTFLLFMQLTRKDYGTLKELRTDNIQKYLQVSMAEIPLAFKLLYLLIIAMETVSYFSPPLNNAQCPRVIASDNNTDDNHLFQLSQLFFYFY